MTFTWKSLPDQDYARLSGQFGSKISLVDGVYWVEVRSLFFRPLLPLTEHRPDTVRPPPRARFGAYQYPVATGDKPNSAVNLLLFQQAREYSVERLDKKRRRQVKLAAKDFEIRVLGLADLADFKRQAHPVYLSFYERTRYQVGAKRQDPAYFAAWADAVFAVPNVLILGAYRNGELGGVSLSYLIRDTVVYATFFCNDEALKRYLSDLMLHSVRELAATSPEVRQVFASMYKGIRGLDEFYLLRGAALVRQPARLEINPLARLLLKNGLPRQYRQLLGQIDEPAAGAGEDGEIGPSPTSKADGVTRPAGSA